MKKILQQAINIANERLENHPEYEFNGFLHFSFLVYKKKIISVGVNHRGNPPVKFGYPDRAKVHSEIDAFEKGKGLVMGDEFSMINIRLNKKGEFRDSYPCETCYRLMKKFGCKRITFSSKNGFSELVF